MKKNSHAGAAMWDGFEQKLAADRDRLAKAYGEHDPHQNATVLEREDEIRRLSERVEEMGVLRGDIEELRDQNKGLHATVAGLEAPAPAADRERRGAQRPEGAPQDARGEESGGA